MDQSNMGGISMSAFQIIIWPSQIIREKDLRQQRAQLCLTARHEGAHPLEGRGFLLVERLQLGQRAQRGLAYG